MQHVSNQNWQSDPCPVQEIDAVYLWVDGRDSAFQEGLGRYLAGRPLFADFEQTSANRFRDSGELRYSLRSLRQYAPWIRHVYLVTNGQVPGWLDRSHPGITVIPHASLFRDRGHLPTFNSNGIETQIHRIPNLSRYFLYMNDDVFLGQAVTPASFLHADGTPRVFLQELEMHDEPCTGPIHDRAYAYTQKVADRLWGRRRPRYLPAHGPQLLDREVLEELERTVPAEFEKTASHRFRSPEDLALRVLYACRVLEGSSAGRDAAEMFYCGCNAYYFAVLRHSVSGNLRQLLDIVRRRPRFFCINDDLGDTILQRAQLRALPWFLSALYPRKSEFERAR